MDRHGYQTSYEIEMLINQTCPSHVHNSWSQILQSTNRIGNKPGTHFFVWSQQRDRGLESKSDQSQLNARKPGFADLYGRGAEALDHMPESLPLFNNAALPLLTGPHLPAGLISISMSASCSQYVITILPGFLALTANLKLQRLSFVRIQLVVKRSGTKEAASL